MTRSWKAKILKSNKVFPSQADGHISGKESSLNVEEVEEEAIVEDLSREGEVFSFERSSHPVCEGNSAEDQKHANCDARKLSYDAQTLSSDWEALDDTRLSCKESSYRGEARRSQSRASTNIDSEPECRGHDGAPGSGSNFQLQSTKKFDPLNLRKC